MWCQFPWQCQSELLYCTVALFYTARPIGKCFSLKHLPVWKLVERFHPVGSRCLAKSVWPTQPTSVHNVVWNWTCWQDDEEKNNSPHLAGEYVWLFILQKFLLSQINEQSQCPGSYIVDKAMQCVPCVDMDGYWMGPCGFICKMTTETQNYGEMYNNYK